MLTTQTKLFQASASVWGRVKLHIRPQAGIMHICCNIYVGML